MQLKLSVHARRGLGHAFLRHIQRTRALLFVLDVSGRLFGDSAPPLPPGQQLALLQRELGLYDLALLRIPALVVANKTDVLAASSPSATEAGSEQCLASSEEAAQQLQRQLEQLRRETQLPVFATSGLQRRGLGELCEALRQYARH